MSVAEGRSPATEPVSVKTRIDSLPLGASDPNQLGVGQPMRLSGITGVFNVLRHLLRILNPRSFQRLRHRLAVQCP